MKETKDKTVLVSEIAEWCHLTPHDVGYIFRGTGIKTRKYTKLGGQAMGYHRYELEGLLADLERAQTESTQAPARDWGCTDCFNVFESRERQPSCPTCGLPNTKIRAQTRAPAMKSASTTHADQTIRELVDDSGMTDYKSSEHLGYAGPPAPVIQTPTGPITSAPVSSQGADIGAAIGLGAGSMRLGLAKGTGNAKINPYRTMRDTVQEMSGGAWNLGQRKPTTVVGQDDRPLPSPV